MKMFILWRSLNKNTSYFSSIRPISIFGIRPTTSLKHHFYHKCLLEQSRRVGAGRQSIVWRRPTSNQSGKSERFNIRKFFVRERRWNMDDILALSSWFLIANGCLLVLGTTAYVSLWLGFITRLPFQDPIIRLLCAKMMAETRIDFIFERAEWKDGCLRLINVNILKEPRDSHATAYKVDINEMDLKLDILMWLDGRSIIKEMAVRGIKGIVNRRHMDFSGVDPAMWLDKRVPQPNDLFLSKLQIEDCMLNVYDTDNFRPYKILIHRADLKRFRIQWLLFDILSAENLVGEYDGAMFSLSKIYFDQSDPKYFSTRLRVANLNIDMLNAGALGPFGWIKSGAVDVDLLISFPKRSFESINTPGVAADLEQVTVKVLDEIKRKIEQRKISLERRFNSAANVNDGEIQDKYITLHENDYSDCSVNENVEFFLDLRFNHIRASIPENYQGGASDVFLRTVIAYLNSQPTAPRYRKTSTPPLSVHFALPLSNFDGSWTIYQSDLLPHVSQCVSDELMKQVLTFYKEYNDKGKMRTQQDDNNNYGNRHHGGSGLLVKVGWWGLQQLSKGILSIVNDRLRAETDSMSEVFDEVVNLNTDSGCENDDVKEED